MDGIALLRASCRDVVSFDTVGGNRFRYSLKISSPTLRKSLRLLGRMMNECGLVNSSSYNIVSSFQVKKMRSLVQCSAAQFNAWYTFQCKSWELEFLESSICTLLYSLKRNINLNKLIVLEESEEPINTSLHTETSSELLLLHTFTILPRAALWTFVMCIVLALYFHSLCIKNILISFLPTWG